MKEIVSIFEQVWELVSAFRSASQECGVGIVAGSRKIVVIPGALFIPCARRNHCLLLKAVGLSPPPLFEKLGVVLPNLPTKNPLRVSGDIAAEKRERLAGC